MLALLARRLLISVPLLIVVSFVTFLLVSLSPTDVAYTLLGSRATTEQVAAVRETLGLDQPLILRYVDWALSAIRGDFGSSLITNQPVMDAVAQRLEPTLSLLIVTIIVIAVSALGLGVIAALRGGWLARVLDILGLLGVAVPGLLIGLGLIIVFTVQLRWLPSVGYSSIVGGLGPWASSLVLPVVALGFGSVGLVSKQVRASMLDALGSEFVRTLTANGFSPRSIILKHVLRSAAVPVLAVLGVTLIGLLGASVLIEQVFGIPGLGGLAVQATVNKDVPVIQGVTIIYTLIVIVVNLLLDVTYVLVNPKVRLS